MSHPHSIDWYYEPQHGDNWSWNPVTIEELRKEHPEVAAQVEPGDLIFVIGLWAPHLCRTDEVLVVSPNAERCPLFMLHSEGERTELLNGYSLGQHMQALTELRMTVDWDHIAELYALVSESEETCDPTK